jgi:hypothetical protein
MELAHAAGEAERPPWSSVVAPEPDRPIVAADRDQMTIGMKGNAGDFGRQLLALRDDHPFLGARSHVPEPCRSVLGAAQEQLAVPAERQRLDLP